MLSFLVPIVEVFQVVIATLASGFFFVIAGITFGASLVGLALSTPLFLIFSPILVPATITTTLLTGAITGVAALSVTAMTLLRWLLKDRMGVKEKNNPAPKGAPTKADKPSVNPEGDTPEGMGGEQQGGGMAGDQQGGGMGGGQPQGMGGDQSGGGMAGDQQGGGMGGGQPGGGMGGDKPEGKPKGKTKHKLGGMGGDKPKGKKGGKPDEMGGDKPKGKKSKGKKGDKPK